MLNLSGVMPALVTPFDANGKIVVLPADLQESIRGLLGRK